MRVLSRAFSRLKTSLPWVPEDTKLSKLDTLRLASGYIAHLRRVLLADDDQASSPGGPSEEACSPPRCLHPLALTWPFSFHQRLPSPVGEETENKVRNVASCRVYDGDASVTSHRVMKPQHHQHQQPPSCHGAHRYPSSADDGFDSFLDYLSSSSGPSQPPHSGRFLSVANHRPMCSS
ncbi:hypothetical protein V5799_029625 [Amblyomma americanum]|uniref:BHLH domain-containing protein n=1 Tax=Amblyomma americanum TaxID=6943 RepID=A0AAQ4EQZ7_AMBAM